MGISLEWRTEVQKREKPWLLHSLNSIEDSGVWDRHHHHLTNFGSTNICWITTTCLVLCDLSPFWVNWSSFFLWAQTVQWTITRKFTNTCFSWQKWLRNWVAPSWFTTACKISNLLNLNYSKNIFLALILQSHYLLSNQHYYTQYPFHFLSLHPQQLH